MTRRFLPAALALLALVPNLVSAQERHAWTNDGGQTRVFNFNRARLGITLSVTADSGSDRYGAWIQSVLPDGPADKAGLKAGDIVTRFNSTSLAGIKPEGEDDSNISGPGRKLIELAQELDPGDTVKVEYRRGGSTQNATIIAREIEPEMAMGRMGPMGGMFRMQPDMEMPKFEGAPGNFKFFGDGPSAMTFAGPENMTFFMGGNFGLQLIELNADLGEYFGTNEGVLVIRTPSDSGMPLRAGDVILAIDGRKPTSVDQALRILHTYEPGETVKLEIMRKHQRTSVDWKVQEHEHVRLRSTRPSGMLTPSRERIAVPGRNRTQL
jgi:C-terminal processing protease CtpA/Prc